MSADPTPARLRELLEKATPGPWKWDGRYIGSLTDGGKGYPLDLYPDSVDVLDIGCDGDCAGCDGWNSHADADLACAAVNALPALLAQLEAAEELARAVKQLLVEIQCTCGENKVKNYHFADCPERDYGDLRDDARAALARYEEAGK